MPDGGARRRCKTEVQDGAWAGFVISSTNFVARPRAHAGAAAIVRSISLEKSRGVAHRRAAEWLLPQPLRTS